MNQKTIWEIALRQSAIDSNCAPSDFLLTEPKVVRSRENTGARRYLKLPFYCDLTSYGNNVVASVCEEIEEPVKRYLEKYPPAHCFETPALSVLNTELHKRGQEICFMAEYFLPDLSAFRVQNCPYPTKILTPEDFSSFYVPAWSNALCKDRKELDVLAVGAYYGETLIGLAGCSADCDDMWQIGIDVLPAFRRQGVAFALTTLLTKEILDRKKVPFYCAAWCNIGSVRNAIKSGFRPAWVQVTSKSRDFVARLNQ